MHENARFQARFSSNFAGIERFSPLFNKRATTRNGIFERPWRGTIRKPMNEAGHRTPQDSSAARCALSRFENAKSTLHEARHGPPDPRGDQVALQDQAAQCRRCQFKYLELLILVVAVGKRECNEVYTASERRKTD
jgi:hypothetical protein